MPAHCLRTPQVKENGALSGPAGERVEAALKAMGPLGDANTAGGAALAHVAGNTDLLEKPSVWIIGGDGWAYDVSRVRGRACAATRPGPGLGSCVSRVTRSRPPAQKSGTTENPHTRHLPCP